MRARTLLIIGVIGFVLCSLAYQFASANTPSSSAITNDIQRMEPSPTALNTPTSAVFSTTIFTDTLIQPMQRERVLHSMTLLLDQTVLVAGGTPSYGNVTVASAEIYDPLTMRFRAIGEMATPRYDHTASLLQSGQVLLAGGTQIGDTALSSAELYNPSSQIFTPTGHLLFARLGHTATTLQSGEVLIVGGSSGTPISLASAELFNPATGTFTLTGSLHIGRMRHTATLLPNGEVLIVGGEQVVARGDGYEGVSTAQAEIYNPKTGLFRRTGTLVQERDRHSATLLQDGRVLIVGGIDWMKGEFLLSSTELYNSQTEQFETAGSLVAGRQDHTATLLTDGNVLIVGGTQTTPCPFAEVYDPVMKEFISEYPVSTNRFYHRALLLPNGDTLITGGSTLGTLDARVNVAEIIRHPLRTLQLRHPSCSYTYLPMIHN